MITKQLQLLMAMHLDFSPTDPKVVKGTKEVWIEAFRDELGLAIEQVDAPRIEQAFRKVRRKLYKWPSPAMVLEHLPPRPPRRHLDHDPRDFEPMPEGMLTGMLNDILAKSKGLEEVE